MPVLRKSHTHRRHQPRQERSFQIKQQPLPQTDHLSLQERLRTPEPSLLSRLNLESSQETVLAGEDWNPSSTTSDLGSVLDMQPSPQSFENSNPSQASLGKRKTRLLDYTAPRSTRPRLESPPDQAPDISTRPASLLSRMSSPTRENHARDSKSSLEERLTSSNECQRELRVTNQISKETKREKPTKSQSSLNQKCPGPKIESLRDPQPIRAVPKPSNSSSSLTETSSKPSSMLPSGQMLRGTSLLPNGIGSSRENQSTLTKSSRQSIKSRPSTKEKQKLGTRKSLSA